VRRFSAFSERAIAIVLGAVALGGAFGVGVWVGRLSMKPHASGEALAKIESARIKAVKAATQPLGETAGQQSSAQRLEEFRVTLGEAAKNLNAEERKPLQAAQQLVARIQPQMREYEAALKALTVAGFVSPMTLKTQDDIRTRGALVKRFQAANEALADYFKNAEGNYRTALDKLGVNEKMRESVLVGFRRGGNFDLNLEIHEANRQLATTMLEMLKLLSDEWGAWRTNDANEVIFDHVEAVKEFEMLQGQLTFAATRQDAAQKKLIERAGKGRKGQ
jgi:hypothetical protein